MIRHVALIKFNSGVTEEQRVKAHDLLRKLGENCGGTEAGILEFNAKPSLDTRKADWVVVSLFSDKNALENYRKHKAHIGLTDLLRTIADWWAGNFEI